MPRIHPVAAPYPHWKRILCGFTIAPRDHDEARALHLFRSEVCSNEDVADVERVLRDRDLAFRDGDDGAHAYDTFELAGRFDERGPHRRARDRRWSRRRRARPRIGRD